MLQMLWCRNDTISRTF